jgi:hypothetical protein
VRYTTMQPTIMQLTTGGGLLGTLGVRATGVARNPHRVMSEPAFQPMKKADEPNLRADKCPRVPSGLQNDAFLGGGHSLIGSRSHRCVGGPNERFADLQF